MVYHPFYLFFKKKVKKELIFFKEKKRFIWNDLCGFF